MAGSANACEHEMPDFRQYGATTTHFLIYLSGMKKTFIPFLSRFARKLKWNKQYRSGSWEVLKSPVEIARFQTVANWVHKLGQHGVVLEVGCGAGLLEKNMRATWYRRFVGIDISSVAISEAVNNKQDNADYLCANMESFATRELFDIIIFNESLYYAEAPLQLVKKYWQFLTTAGYLIASIYETKANIALVHQLKERFDCVAHDTTSNERGVWHCLVFQQAAIKKAHGR